MTCQVYGDKRTWILLKSSLKAGFHICSTNLKLNRFEQIFVWKKVSLVFCFCSGVNPTKLWFLRFFQFLLISLAIFKYWQYFLMLKTLMLNNKKQKKIFILRRKKFGRIDSRFQFEKFFISFSRCREGILSRRWSSIDV